MKTLGNETERQKRKIIANEPAERLREAAEHGAVRVIASILKKSPAS